MDSDLDSNKLAAHAGIIKVVHGLVEERHITKDKLAQEVRAVSQMAAFDGNYNHAISGYRLVSELKGFITKSGEVPPPAGGVHQHNHVHFEPNAIDGASDDDLKAQLGKITMLESRIKDAEYSDDVDLS